MNKRREMERKIYERHKAEGTVEDYIQDRKDASAARYRERCKSAEIKQADMRAGREYVEKNQVPLFVGVLGNYAVTAGALLKTDKTTNTAYYRVAYCLCSPKDAYRLKVAEGYVGYRLSMDNDRVLDNPYSFSILTGGGSIKPFRLMRLIEIHIQMDMLAPRIPGPNKLIQLMTKTQPYFRMVQIKEEKDYEEEKSDSVRGHQSGNQGQMSPWHVLHTLRSESADVHERLRLASRTIPYSPVPFATIT